MTEDVNLDPFAVLRAIENGHSDQAEALFTGSEPVGPGAGPGEPSTPAPAPAPAPAAEPVLQLGEHATANVSPQTQLTMAQLDTIMRDALLALEARIVALEALAKRNGWPL